MFTTTARSARASDGACSASAVGRQSPRADGRARRTGALASAAKRVYGRGHVPRPLRVPGSRAGLHVVKVMEEDFALSSTDFDAEKLDSLETMFADADVDGTGKLGPSEIRSLLECAGSFCYALHVMTEEETLKIIRRYDTNGDELLDFQEFIKFANDKLLLESHLKNYEAAFKRLDRRGTGRLAVPELRELFQALDAEGSEVGEMTDAKLNHMVIKYAQVDSKGLTFEEFLIMARNILPEVDDIMVYLEMGDEPSAVEEKKGGFRALLGMLEETLTSNVEVVRKKRWERSKVNEVKSMEEFQLLLQEEKGPIILEVGFTFCKPCKKFASKYKLFAEHYKDVLFLKVYGNRNQSCKREWHPLLPAPSLPSPGKATLTLSFFPVP